MSTTEYNKIYEMEKQAGKSIVGKYDYAYETLFYETTRKIVADMAINQNKESLRVLDLGCGPGNLTKFLLNDKKHTIVAVDISFDMLGMAKSKLNEIGRASGSERV